MKRKLQFGFLLILLSSLASSQTFQGGISGGLNAARIDGDGHELYGKLGLNAGAFVAREIIPEILFWQLELKYTSRGKYNLERDWGGTVIGKDLIDLRYIEMPFSVHYFFSEKIQAEFGIAPDVLIKQYWIDENGDYTESSGYDLRRFGITALIGANYFIRPELAVGIRFNYSLIPFYKFSAYAIRYRDSGWFHDVLSLNLRYYFSR